jgi:hypothetical protein
VYSQTREGRGWEEVEEEEAEEAREEEGWPTHRGTVTMIAAVAGVITTAAVVT